MMTAVQKSSAIYEEEDLNMGVHSWAAGGCRFLKGNIPEDRTAIYGICIQICAAVKFSLGQGQKSESLKLEQGIIFQKTDKLVEDFSLDYGRRAMKGSWVASYLQLI